VECNRKVQGVPEELLERRMANFPRSQTLFGNALVFAVTQPPKAARPGFPTLFRGEATELPGQWHSQTEFGEREVDRALRRSMADTVKTSREEARDPPLRNLFVPDNLASR
jgi:hypothetical protein